MNRNRSRLLAVSIAALVWSTAGFAAPENATEEFRVTVYRGERAVDEMRFADATALEGWLKTRQAEARATGTVPRNAEPLANPFLPEAAYLQTDAEGRSLMP